MWGSRKGGFTKIRHLDCILPPAEIKRGGSGGGGVQGIFSLCGGIVREKGTLASLSDPNWTPWPKMLAYMHSK